MGLLTRKKEDSSLSSLLKNSISPAKNGERASVKEALINTVNTLCQQQITELIV